MRRFPAGDCGARDQGCEGRKVKSLFAQSLLPIIATMDFSSKDYDRIRASRRRGRGGGRGDAGAGAAVLQRECAWEGCNGKAEYRAPKGRGHEGQFFHFCLDHVREYNKSYNYFEGMTDDDVIAYQRDSLTGHRPTSPIGVTGRKARASKSKSAWNSAYEDPFGLFGEDKGQPQAPPPERRRISAAVRNALDILGLEEDASKEAIKARYKTLVKRHHPDANHGDRSSEDRLRSVINAYNALRRNGHC
ncbi:J domain-containing protein [Acuticoccus sp. MNP-M23]|uniref:J domain-containing protein n=1 Tax=Acuticoccus sp. MNP-M23 TaxID=3072793 RepID=UPI002815F2EE|nr:J domain-containing protein [Acuticoccus sp. MNP-M23]WMS43642.1 J domain-containing protein [Acuticoccus sp. MNP-M23]